MQLEEVLEACLMADW